MKASGFIARKMISGGQSTGRQSNVSNTIAWISVCLSFTVMIISISVLGGFKREIRSKATGFIGSVQLVAPGTSPLNEIAPVQGDLSYLWKIREMDGVTSVDGVAYRSGMVKTDAGIDGLCFKGVDSLYSLSFFESTLSEGTLPDFRGRISNDILVSRTVADRLGIGVGDGVVSYFVGDRVSVRKFNVSGVFDAQLENVDRMAVVDLRQIQRLNGWEKNQVSSIEIGLGPKADITRVQKGVEEIEFLDAGENDQPLFVTSVKKVYGYLFDWLSVLDMNVAMILSLMMIVAGFNMISAVLIILFEKISMIGLLKALGMTDRKVGRVFLLRSLAIVGKGLLWGNVAGIAICLIQKYFKVITLDPASYFVPYVPIELNPLHIFALDIAALVGIMAIVSLSSLFISRVSPDRTMKTE